MNAILSLRPDQDLCEALPPEKRIPLPLVTPVTPVTEKQRPRAVVVSGCPGYPMGRLGITGLPDIEHVDTGNVQHNWVNFFGDGHTHSLVRVAAIREPNWDLLILNAA